MQHPPRINSTLEGELSLLQPPSFKYFTFLILIIVALTFVFLALGNYARKVQVTGVLQPKSGILKLQSTQSGIISELLVQEGQSVRKGQPLLRVKAEKQGLSGFELNSSIIKQLLEKKNTTLQQVSSLKILHDLQLTSVENEIKNFRMQAQQLNLQKQIYQRRIELNEGVLKKLTTLRSTGYISALEIKKQQDSLLYLQQQTSQSSLSLLKLNSKIKKSINNKTLLPIKYQQKVDQLSVQLSQINLQISSVEQKRLTEIRAPSSGVISSLLAKQGKMVSINQNLLSLLPQQAKMQAIMYIPPSAFGFIEKGQKLRIRYQAFPYEKFGIYHGEIIETGANVIWPNETVIPNLISQPSYRIVVQLSSQAISAFGKQIPLKSGMKLEADVIIDKRTLLRWLFEPFYSIRAQNN